jgi:hypothetical protein
MHPNHRVAAEQQKSAEYVYIPRFILNTKGDFIREAAFPFINKRGN